VKLDIFDDDIPLLVSALEHYSAHLEAAGSDNRPYRAIAERLQRKGPQQVEWVESQQGKSRPA
jgi:hypothetical protein